MNTFILFCTAFLSAVIFIPFAIKTGRSGGWFEANDERKTHREKVSPFGGIAIYFATAIALASVVRPGMYAPVMAFALALPLLIVGIMDDLSGIGISTRMVLHVLLGVLVFEMGFQISVSGNWMLDLAGTVFTVALLINAYNFIDGINGLAGSLGLVGSLFFGFLFLASGQNGMAAFCLAYAGSLTGFLVYNFREKARVFMGDSGSTVMGFFMAVMLMAFLKTDAPPGGNSSWPIILALVGIPVFDLFKVCAFRVFRGRSPFCPDRTHIHHLLTDGLFSHPLAAFLLAGWTAGLAGFAYAFPPLFTLPDTLAFFWAPHVLTAVSRYVKREGGSELMVKEMA